MSRCPNCQSQNVVHEVIAVRHKVTGFASTSVRQMVAEFASKCAFCGLMWTHREELPDPRAPRPDPVALP